MPRIHYFMIKRQVTMDDVLQLIGWDSSTGSKKRGSCPVHGNDSKRRSNCFSVDRQGNRFQCFKCGAKGNQLDLYCLANKQKIYEGTIDLCNRLGIQIPYFEVAHA